MLDVPKSLAPGELSKIDLEISPVAGGIIGQVEKHLRLRVRSMERISDHVVTIKFNYSPLINVSPEPVLLSGTPTWQDSGEGYFEFTFSIKLAESLKDARIDLLPGPRLTIVHAAHEGVSRDVVARFVLATGEPLGVDSYVKLVSDIDYIDGYNVVVTGQLADPLYIHPRMFRIIKAEAGGVVQRQIRIRAKSLSLVSVSGVDGVEVVAWSASPQPDGELVVDCSFKVIPRKPLEGDVQPGIRFDFEGAHRASRIIGIAVLPGGM